MNKLLILLFLIPMISNNVYAKKLNGKWQCPSMSDLQSCSNKCKDYDKFEFLVKGNTVILKQWYSVLNSKTPDYTEVLEDCSVIDKNNWICKSISYDDGILRNEFFWKMINGIYYSYGSLNNDVSPEFGWCAK